MHVFLAIALLIGLFAVPLALAFWGPTLPAVKSSAPKGYATTMDSNDNPDTDEMPTIVDAPAVVRHTSDCDHTGGDCTEACDPSNFTVVPAFESAVDAVFDIAMAYGISADEVMATLAARVAEGDQR